MYTQREIFRQTQRPIDRSTETFGLKDFFGKMRQYCAFEKYFAAKKR